MKCRRSRGSIVNQELPTCPDGDPGLVLIEHAEKIAQMGPAALQPPGPASSHIATQRYHATKTRNGPMRCCWQRTWRAVASTKRLPPLRSHSTHLLIRRPRPSRSSFAADHLIGHMGEADHGLAADSAKSVESGGLHRNARCSGRARPLSIFRRAPARATSRNAIR
jgi:hypothetical protein